MADTVDIEALLALPAMGGVPAPLAALLRAAADEGPAPCSDPVPVLEDTLEALALLDADGEVMAAAILHVVPAWAARHAASKDAAGSALPALLEGQEAANQVWALHAEQVAGRSHEGLRRLLLAIVRDLRVVPILLARQLARMRAAPALPEAERLALARLTRDIHAPLANRLGIWQLKWELEDLAFRHLEPTTYQRIAKLLDDTRTGRERYIAEVTTILGESLRAVGIEGDIAGRPKHIYSIWKKMQKKNVPIGELYDLRAVRVLVEDVQACYAALGVVHALWTPVPGEFDDYIARPKNNDYRSLHTAVVGPEGKTVEVQIRTREMHEQAERGVAAHWRYKESGGSQRSAAGEAAVNRKIEWMRSLLESAGDSGEGGLAGAFDTELVEDRIYALTPKGEVVDLPRGSTPLDFAYRVHTEVGHRCRGAKVDGRIVPLDYVLRTGDRVEIMTGKVSEPRRDWLLATNGYLASARSREKVRAWFHKLDRARNLHDGREMLDRELKRVGLGQADLSPVLKRFNVDAVDELYVHVALGDVGPHQVARALAEHERAQREAAEGPGDDGVIAVRAPRRVRRDGGQDFTVVGVDNLLVQIARCCHPLPGEAISGYLTRARGVSVHRADCASFARLAANEPQRVLPVEWGGSGGGHEAAVILDAIDHRHLLKDVTDLIAQEDAHVISIDGGGAGRARGHVQLRLSLRVADFGQLSRLLGRLESLPGVERARRA